MQHVSHRASDEIAQLREEAATLRANLRSVTDHLDTLMSEGFPAKGRTADDRDSWIGWRDDVHASIASARAALAQPSR